MCVCFRVLELEESLGSSHLLQQNIKQKDEKVSSLNQVIQEREEKLAELENRSEIDFDSELLERIFSYTSTKLRKMFVYFN